MQFTTQKQQLKEYRRAIREERWALGKRAFKTVVDRGACYLICYLIIVTPAIGLVLGSIKD